MRAAEVRVAEPDEPGHYVDEPPAGVRRRGRHRRRARHRLQVLLVERDAGRQRERRLEVRDDRLARHQRLDLGPQVGDILLRGAPQDRAVAFVGQPEDEERVELREQLVIDQLRLLRHGAEADLELPALARQPREHVLVAALRAGEHPLGLLERDERRRQPVEAVAVGSVELRVRLEEPARDHRRDEDLLHPRQPGGVHEHGVAVGQLLDDALRQRRLREVARDARHLEDPLRATLDHLERAGGHRELLGEGGHVLLLADRHDPILAVVPDEPPDRVLLRVAPLVRGLQIALRDLRQRQAQRRRAGAGGACRVDLQPVGRPRVVPQAPT